MTDGFKGLYAIADVGVLNERSVGLREFGLELRASGAGLLQLRNKSGSPQDVLRDAGALKAVFDGLLIMNDRPDLAILADFDGVHVGQDDLPVEEVRTIGGNRMLVGISTHTDEQVASGGATNASYVAVGPVFATATKADAAAAVGLDGVRRARQLTTKPLVAIGGITRANAASVVEAGADALAVISGLLVQGETVEKVARDFLEFFR